MKLRPRPKPQRNSAFLGTWQTASTHLRTASCSVLGTLRTRRAASLKYLLRNCFCIILVSVSWKKSMEIQTTKSSSSRALVATATSWQKLVTSDFVKRKPFIGQEALPVQTLVEAFRGLKGYYTMFGHLRLMRIFSRPSTLALRNEVRGQGLGLDARIQMASVGRLTRPISFLNPLVVCVVANVQYAVTL